MKKILFALVLCTVGTALLGQSSSYSHGYIPGVGSYSTSVHTYGNSSTVRTTVNGRTYTSYVSTYGYTPSSYTSSYNVYGSHNSCTPNEKSRQVIDNYLNGTASRTETYNIIESQMKLSKFEKGFGWTMLTTGCAAMIASPFFLLGDSDVMLPVFGCGTIVALFSMVPICVGNKRSGQVNAMISATGIKINF